MRNAQNISKYGDDTENECSLFSVSVLCFKKVNVALKCPRPASPLRVLPNVGEVKIIWKEKKITFKDIAIM